VLNHAVEGENDDAFWKRDHYDTNNAFWKRTLPRSFWKRLGNDEIVGESDDGSMYVETDGLTNSNEVHKKSSDGSLGVAFGKQQRRGHVSSQRRPEFNPTGW